MKPILKICLSLLLLIAPGGLRAAEVKIEFGEKLSQAADIRPWSLVVLGVVSGAEKAVGDLFITSPESKAMQGFSLMADHLKKQAYDKVAVDFESFEPTTTLEVSGKAREFPAPVARSLKYTFTDKDGKIVMKATVFFPKDQLKIVLWK